MRGERVPDGANSIAFACVLRMHTSTELMVMVHTVEDPAKNEKGYMRRRKFSIYAQIMIIFSTIFLLAGADIVQLQIQINSKRNLVLFEL